MLSWPDAVVYGAIGGLVIEAVFTWQRVHDWQQARHAARRGRSSLPTITAFVDPGPDLLVGVSRAMLGAVAGWLLHGEVTGVYAAVTVGASAPAVLATLGKTTSPSGLPQAEGTAASPPRLTLPPGTQPEAAE
jgi:hypothetical protein